MTILHTLVLLSAGASTASQNLEPSEPVTIVSGRMSGHVHPSVCASAKGTLLAFYRGDNVIMRVRSRDGGRTWDKPTPVAETANRPDFIPPVPKFEVYPGSVDALKDGRILLTWNYNARDEAKKFEARPLLFSISPDDGDTWTPLQSFGKLTDKYLGAMRNSILEWAPGRWLLVPRDHRPVWYDVKTRKLEPFDIEVGKGKRAASLQVVRTAKETLLSMGTHLLRSSDGGKTWEDIAGFPAAVKGGDDAKGRFLTPLADGTVVVTWGVGRQNMGFLLAASFDDGKTWQAKPLHRLPDTPVTARFGAPRTVELKDGSLGTVFYHERGLFFLRTSPADLKRRSP
jgi:hypothetical protein